MLYSILLILALWFNRNEHKLLLLSLIIGIGVFIPVPSENFYLCCAIGELVILLTAWSLNTANSVVVILLSVQLITAHIFGHYLNGYLTNSPYHVIVKVDECLELLSCIIFSKPIISKLFRN